MTEVLRAALIGCGQRGRLTYLPVLTAMTEHFRLCAVCDPDERRLAEASAQYGVAGYRWIENLLQAESPDVCVLAVTPPPAPENGRALLQCAQAGVPALAETPIALTLAEADRIVAAISRSGTVAEIAENYFRTPRERFKRELLRAGLFGDVNVVYADFVGHGYHGISLLRSYVGFEQVVLTLWGDRHRYPAAELPGRGEGRRGEGRRGEGRAGNDELWQFGVLEFGNGARGIFSFSTLSYHSPLRPRSRAEVRFLATRGMGVGDELTALRADGTAGGLVIEPVLEPVQGIEVLAALIARGTDVTWENPLRRYPLPDGDQHGPLTIGLQLLALHRAVTDGAGPEYGVSAARYDRLIDLALQRSWDTKAPVSLDDLDQPHLPSRAQ